MSAEDKEALMALMDAGVALAETFEVLLSEFLHTPRSSTTTTAS